LSGNLEVVFTILVGMEYHHDGRKEIAVSEREERRDDLDKHINQREREDF
jgi:hypothetical protein